MPRRPFGTESLRSDGSNSTTLQNRHVSFNNEVDAKRFPRGLDVTGSVYPEERHITNGNMYRGLHRVREDDEGSLEREFYPRDNIRRPVNEIADHRNFSENRTLERNVPKAKHYAFDSLPSGGRKELLAEEHGTTGPAYYAMESNSYRNPAPYSSNVNDFLEESESDAEQHHQSFDSWDRKRNNFQAETRSGSESDLGYGYHSSQSPTRKPRLTKGNVSLIAQQLSEETKQRQQARQQFGDRNANLSFEGARNENRPFSYMDCSPTRSPYKPATSSPPRFFHDEDERQVFAEDATVRITESYAKDRRTKRSRAKPFGSDSSSEEAFPVPTKKYPAAYDSGRNSKTDTAKRIATYVFGEEGTGGVPSNNRKDVEHEKGFRPTDQFQRRSYAYNAESQTRPVDLPKMSYATQNLVYNNLDVPQFRKHDDTTFRASYRSGPAFDTRGSQPFESLLRDPSPIRKTSPLERSKSPVDTSSYRKSNHDINILRDRKVNDHSFRMQEMKTELPAPEDRYRHGSPQRQTFVSRAGDFYDRNSSSPERQPIPAKRAPVIVQSGPFAEPPRGAYRSSRRSDFETLQRRNEWQVPRMGTSMTSHNEFTHSTRNEPEEMPKPPLRLKKMTGYQTKDRTDSTTFHSKPVYLHNKTNPEVKEEFRSVRNLVGQIQSQEKTRMQRNPISDDYRAHSSRSSSSITERSSPSPVRQPVKKPTITTTSPIFKKGRAPDIPRERTVADLPDKPAPIGYIRARKPSPEQYYVAKHAISTAREPEYSPNPLRKFNEDNEDDEVDYRAETVVQSLPKHMSRKSSDENSNRTSTSRNAPSSVRFADNFTDQKSRKDYGSKRYRDLESRNGVVFQSNELESGGESDKDSKIQRQRKNFLSVFLGGDRRFNHSKKTAKQTNNKPDNRDKSVPLPLREDEAYKVGTLKNDKALGRKSVKQKKNSKEDAEVGRGMVKGRSAPSFEYGSTLKASPADNKDYRASPYLDNESEDGSYFKVQAMESNDRSPKENSKYSSSYSLKRSDTLKRNSEKISNTEREGQFATKPNFTKSDGYFVGTTHYSAEDDRGRKIVTESRHPRPEEFEDDSTVYFTTNYANRKKEPSPTRYFGDTDTERRSKESSSGSPRHAYVSGPKRLERSTSHIGDSRRDKKDRNLNPRRPTGLAKNNFLSSSESELSSKISNQISGASAESRRSVYVHASRVAKIPKFHGAELKNASTDVENQSHHTSTEGSVDRLPGTLQRGANFQRSKQISRSFSVLTPWKPRHYKENYEITYNNNQTIKPLPAGKGKPPRPPGKRREVQHEKSSSTVEASPASKPDNLSTLQRNPIAEKEKDKDKNKNSVSRSSTMPKDSRMAGWFRRIRK